MPEMEVDRNKLLSQIKEAHGKVMYTYTAHHKIADRAKKRKAILDCVEIVITSVSAVCGRRSLAKVKCQRRRS